MAGFSQVSKMGTGALWWSGLVWSGLVPADYRVGVSQDKRHVVEVTGIAERELCDWPVSRFHPAFIFWPLGMFPKQPGLFFFFFTT